MKGEMKKGSPGKRGFRSEAALPFVEERRMDAGRGRGEDQCFPSDQ